MKKVLLSIIAVVLILSTLISCESPNQRLDIDVDHNFTGLGTNDLYGTILGISSNPNDYMGKTVAITANVSCVYSFDTHRIISTVIFALDPTNCCDAYYEIVKEDGIYPNFGTSATIVGTFGSNYITANEIRANEDAYKKADIDTLAMSKDEVLSFIKDYYENHKTSDAKGKTISVIGHYTRRDQYLYLIGVDTEGNTTWQIELGKIAEGVNLPVQNGNYLNPVHITGTLSYYTEGTRTYACIDVLTAQKVVGLLI